MDAQERIDEIVNQMIFENIHFPPKSAVGAYEFAKEGARQYRIAACIAAESGLQEQAISLTEKAQKCDRVAIDWQKEIPDWQRESWY